jgi:DnaK suppressor protein
MTSRDKQLAVLERTLKERAKFLRGEVSEKLGDAAEDAGGMNAGGDFGDQSYASSESSLDFAEADRDLQELRAIDAALRAIEDGSYGTCESCGLEIPAERLRAQPLALRCIVCQGRDERARGIGRSSI